MAYLLYTERVSTLLFSQRIILFVYHIISYPQVCFEYMLKIIVIIRPERKKEMGSLI